MIDYNLIQNNTIYCFYDGPVEAGKCNYRSKSFVIVDNCPVIISEAVSTTLRWTKQDIGYQTIHPRFRTDFDRCRKTYSKIFQNREYKLIWTTKSEFKRILDAWKKQS